MCPRRVTQKPWLQLSNTVVWIFHKPRPCFLFMSCLNTPGLIPFTEPGPVYLSDITRARVAQRCSANGGGKERALSFITGPGINQTNYGAATVSNPWRGNEMIGGGSQLNTEWVNENINYLMIYWECGTRRDSRTSLSLTGPDHREHLF